MYEIDRRGGGPKNRSLGIYLRTNKHTNSLKFDIIPDIKLATELCILSI